MIFFSVKPLRKTLNGQPKLILLGLKILKMGGLEVLRRVKGSEDYTHCYHDIVA
ncbi:MAG: hypothetical protein ABIN99_11495 [Nitrosospira sp.]